MTIRCPEKPWEEMISSSLLNTRHSMTDIIHRIREESPLFFSAKDKDTFADSVKKIGSDRHIVLEADQILQGKFTYFSFHQFILDFPPNWFQNPISQERIPPNVHWSLIEDFRYGDIKGVWELSRFGFVFTLARAYALTSDEKYAEAFWQLVEDWRRNNPPNTGPNWKCGQEISFRIMAWCFGLYLFTRASTSTNERMTSLIQMIAVSGERINSNIRYALSQKNNHGISEAAGIFTIGILFPEFRKSVLWKRKGRLLLEKLANELIYNDGAFCQHSAGYHRLMLQDYLWVLRLSEIKKEPFGLSLQKSVETAVLFLYQLVDNTTGDAPCYGQNDGSNILPLDSCRYSDFRPILQALWYTLKKKRIFPSGPWDEGLLWLNGPSSLEGSVDDIPKSDLHAKAGGCYTLHDSYSSLFIRCGRYFHRPSHADMLHADVRWRNQNIAVDAGTFSYNAPEPWNNPLSETRYHNTITIDGFDQMIRAGRFLWLPWIEGRIEAKVRSEKDSMEYSEMTHNGFERLKDPLSYRRGVLRLGEESWLVLDMIRAKKEHDIRLHWLISDYEFKESENIGGIVLHTPKGKYSMQYGVFSGSFESDIKRADRRSPRGWQAPAYHHRVPALSIQCSQKTSKAVFYSFFSPESSVIQGSESGLIVRNSLFRLELSVDDTSPYSLKSCTYNTSAFTDQLTTIS